MPDWPAMAALDDAIDLVAVGHGGRALSCSDQFFSVPANLIVPGRSNSMQDGWETRRRRGEGHDWVTLALGHRGTVERLVVDTAHFKGNYPESCSVEGCDHPEGSGADLTGAAWRPVLPRTALSADREHVFQPIDSAPVTHVRLNIYPDGGVSRFRVLGHPMDVR